MGAAATLGGAVNALAGGGTLITFPVLTFLGVPPVVANITITLSVCPGYLGGMLAQWHDLRSQTSKLWLLPVGGIGGILGGWLLLNSGAKLFALLIPVLIFVATSLLALQNPLRNWLQKRPVLSPRWQTQGCAALAIGLAAIYGGYFGAGLSVIILAILGLVYSDDLKQLNSFKQAISLSVNATVAVLFAFSGQVIWPIAGIMAVGALVGGFVGGRIAQKINANHLRYLVVIVGVVLTIVYAYKLF